MKITKSILMTGLITGYFVLGTQQVSAAENLQEFSLDPMVVTAQRMETKDLDTPDAVEVFTGEELLAKGGNNLQEALKYATGIIFQAQGSKGTSQGTMNSKIIIRGVEKGSLILVDGVPINQSGRYNLDTISTEMIEKVEIVRGGGAVLYGSEATGGVINIITKSKRANKVKTSFGNYGQQSHAASLQTGKLGFTYAYDKIGKVDNISDPAGGRPKGNYYNIVRGEHNNFNLRYNFSDNLFFSHTYSENNSHYVYKYKPQNDAVNKNVIHTDKTHMSQLNYHDDNIKAILFYNDKDQNSFTKANAKKKNPDKTYTYLERLGSLENTGHHDKSFGFDVQKNWQLKEDRAILGVTFQHDNCEYQEDEFEIKTAKSKFIDREYKRNMYSVYGQYDYAMSDVSNLIFSARQTWTGQTKEDDNNGENYQKFVPELQYINKIDEDTSFYAKASKSFMMPTFTQMFGSGNIVGNANLKPQSGRHFEVGLKKNIANQAWRLAVYNYQIDDSIEAKWSKDHIKYTNEDVRNTGVELTCAIDLGDGLNGNFGVSYSRPEKFSTVTENGMETEGRWRDYYGRVQINGGLSYVKDKWNSALNFNYMCKRTRDIDEEVPMKPYLFTNLSVAYHPEKNSKIFLNVDNLLDRQDIITSAGSSFYTMGRNFMLGYECQF